MDHLTPSYNKHSLAAFIAQGVLISASWGDLEEVQAMRG
jgi:hypothetical protein